MKIVVLHQYYLLPGQPGGSRFNEMARIWAAAGHQVEVIAGTVNYVTGERPARYRQRWVTHETDGPVSVWRCHVPTSYTRGYVGRMWAFAGFTLSAATAALRIADADVVIATSPPLVVVLAGWIAALRSRCPLVFEVRDLWPESAVTTGVLRRGSLMTRALYALEHWACRRSALITVLTPAFREDLVSRGLAPATRIAAVPNGADVATFRPRPRDNPFRERLGWGNRIVALYAGAHGRANAIGQLVHAAEHLARRRPDILIACVGDGPERIRWERAAQSRGLKNVTFHGAQPKEAMAEIVSAADIGLAVLQNNPTFKTVYPNKVFDYMACERPVVLAIDGVARQLVCDQANAGVWVEAENGQAIADAIVYLADHAADRAAFGANGRHWVLANATREVLARRYLEVLTPLVNQARRSPYRNVVKPCLDRAAALVLLVVLSPVLLTVAGLVRCRLGRPILFRQPRPGRNGRPFTLLKFRTMSAAGDGQGTLLPDGDRLTHFGRVLRSTSLDELPELLNVLTGDMSLVGPRPLLLQYLPRYSAEQARRHDVKPGITGLAQINGRNALTWEEKFAFDVKYVDSVSFAVDLKILATTLRKLVTREGIHQPGHATAQEFMGSR
jgi:lipopolysaccharide/colanic/teichoic acid biosynthesis glycosyltransferase